MCETKVKQKQLNMKIGNIQTCSSFKGKVVVTIHYSFINNNNLEIYTFLNTEFKMVTLKFEFDHLQHYFQVCKHA